MAKPAIIKMISEATVPTVSNTFVNNKCDACSLQITGTFTSATVSVEGIVDVNSGSWVSLATFDLTDLDIKTAGMSDKSIYQVGITGILRVRVNVTAVAGGNITVVANFVGTSWSGEELPPSSEVPFTAYDEAVLGGYTGTKAAFDAGLANVMNMGPLVQQAQNSANNAAASANQAANAANNAAGFAGSAVTSANAAAAYASEAASAATAAEDALNEITPEAVTGWLDENVDPVGSAVIVDSSLTISGAAADAKVTGGAVVDLKTQIDYGFASTPDSRFVFQLGVNRYTHNNKLDKLDNYPSRASAVPLTSPSRYIKVVPKPDTTVAFHGYYSDAWHTGADWGANPLTTEGVIDTASIAELCIQVGKGSATVTANDLPDVYTQELLEAKEEIYGRKETITSAFFQNAIYRNLALEYSAIRLYSRLIWVEPGDIIYITSPTLGFAAGIYSPTDESNIDSTVWIDPSADVFKYVCKYYGKAVVFFRHTDNSNINLSEYDATVEIVRTIPAKIDLLTKGLDTLLPENVKRIAFLGDSITAGSGVTGTGESLPYHMRLHERFGWACYNYGYGGSGYVRSYPGTEGLMATGQEGMGVPMTSETIISNNDFVNRITTVDTDVDAIVIYGGTNDWSNGITLANFTSAVENVFSYAQTNFVGKQIIIATPIHRNNDTQPQFGTGGTLKEYVDIIKAACTAHGLLCIDLFSDSGLYPGNTANKNYYFKGDDTGTVDGVHPNGEGHRNIANILAEKLITVLY